MNNKTVIKRLLYYLLIRNTPAAMLLLGFMTQQPLSEYISGAVNLPGFFLVAILPLFLGDVLVFGVPYFCLFKGFLSGGHRPEHNWYWSGLLLMETAMIKLTIFNDVPLLLLAAFFVYFRIFTWYYLTSIRQRQKTV